MSDSVNRYSEQWSAAAWASVLEPDDDGEYVRYDDYESMLMDAQEDVGRMDWLFRKLVRGDLSLAATRDAIDDMMRKEFQDTLDTEEYLNDDGE